MDGSLGAHGLKPVVRSPRGQQVAVPGEQVGEASQDCGPAPGVTRAPDQLGEHDEVSRGAAASPEEVAE